jgi:hypothetical protein
MLGRGERGDCGRLPNTECGVQTHAGPWRASRRRWRPCHRRCRCRWRARTCCSVSEREGEDADAAEDRAGPIRPYVRASLSRRRLQHESTSCRPCPRPHAHAHAHSHSHFPPRRAQSPCNVCRRRVHRAGRRHVGGSWSRGRRSGLKPAARAGAEHDGSGRRREGSRARARD